MVAAFKDKQHKNYNNTKSCGFVDYMVFSADYCIFR